MNVIQRLIEKLYCKHEWVIWYEITHIDDFGGRYIKQTLVCEKYGKVKQIEL